MKRSWGAPTVVAAAYAVATVLLATVPYLLGTPIARTVGRSSVLLLAALALWTVADRQRDHNSRTGWRLIAGHFLLAALASFAWGVGALDGTPLPKPSPADLVYLASYGLLLVGCQRVVRGLGGGRRTDSLDAVIGAVAIGAIAWTLLLREALPGSQLGPVAVVNAALYPLADLAVLAVIGRLWFVGSGRAGIPYRVIVSGFAVALMADAAYAALVLTGSLNPGRWLGIGWLMGTLLVVVGALLAPTDPHRLPDPEDRRGIGRVVVLLALGCLLPALVALESFAVYDVAHSAVVSILVTVSFALVIFRVRELAADFRQLVLRERLLRESGTRFVAAPDRAGITSVLLETVARLAGYPAPVWLISIADGTAVVTASSEEAAGQVLSREALLAIAGDYRHGQRVIREPGVAHAALRVPDDRVLLTVWIDEGREPESLIVVATADVPDGELVPVIRSVMENARLAADRIALNRRTVEHQSADRMQRMLAQTSDVIALVDAAGDVTYASPSIESVLGISPGMVQGVAFADLIAEDHRAEVIDLLAAAREGVSAEIEVRAVTAAGESRILHIVAARLSTDGPPELVLTCHDTTERYELTRQLRRQAYHDPLTGLANRELFGDRLAQASARARRTGRTFSVLMLDLDDFKTINDTLGHAAGDDLIIDVANRISAGLRSHDTAARLGGDEFAVLLEELSGEDEALRIARRIAAAIAAPISLEGRRFSVAASVGLVIDDGSRGDPSELLRDADLAMYAAKASGEGKVRRFEPAMYRTMVRRLELAEQVTEAVARQEFLPYYQPIVSLQSGRVEALEMLARWDNPMRGIVKPAEFMAAAEDSRQIVALTRVLITGALQQHAGWLGEHPGLRLHLNLSARELQEEAVVTDLLSALREHATAPELLAVEVAESTLINADERMVARMERIAEAGVRLYVDGFGSRHASFSLLTRFPIRGIKIARQLVAALPVGGPDARITTALHQVADSLDLDGIIAEGVETTAQAAALRALGFRTGQGYLFGRPGPAAQVDRLLVDHAAELR